MVPSPPDATETAPTIRGKQRRHLRTTLKLILFGFLLRLVLWRLQSFQSLVTFLPSEQQQDSSATQPSPTNNSSIKFPWQLSRNDQLRIFTKDARLFLNNRLSDEELPTVFLVKDDKFLCKSRDLANNTGILRAEEVGLSKIIQFYAAMQFYAFFGTSYTKSVWTDRDSIDADITKLNDTNYFIFLPWCLIMDFGGIGGARRRLRYELNSYLPMLNKYADKVFVVLEHPLLYIPENYPDIRVFVFDQTLQGRENKKNWTSRMDNDVVLPISHMGPHCNCPAAHPSDYATEGKRRETLIMFSGDTKHAFKGGDGKNYRKLLLGALNSTNNSSLVNIACDVTREEYDTLHAESKFCATTAGDTMLTQNIFRSIRMGCVPIYILDPPIIELKGFPFYDFINWESFMVTISLNQLQSDPNSLVRHCEELVASGEYLNMVQNLIVVRSIFSYSLRDELSVTDWGSEEASRHTPFYFSLMQMMSFSRNVTIAQI